MLHDQSYKNQLKCHPKFHIDGPSLVLFAKKLLAVGEKHQQRQIKLDGTPLSSGYIALQSESHPIDFRKVALFDLKAYASDAKKLKEVLRTLAKE